MFPHGLVSLLWLVLLQDVSGLCGRPAWSTIVWEVPPQDLEQSKIKEQFNCLHHSVCQICNYFSGLKLSKKGLEILYASCQVALFMVVGLSIHYLLSKVKLKKDRKAAIPIPAVSTATEIHAECTQKMICKLVANSSKMMKYVKHVAHQLEKDVRYRKLNRKKADEMDDELLFSICPQKHSSSIPTGCMKTKNKQKPVPCYD